MDVWANLMLIAGGLFAGGSATFAWSRVPIWRRMALPEFLRDFSQTLHWTDKVQPALLVVAAASAAAYAIAADGTAGTLAWVAVAGFVLTLIGSVTYMVPLQRRIVASSPGDADAVEPMRLRWFRANLGRSALATAAFVVTALAATV